MIKKIRSPKHLLHVRSHPCCITKDGENCNGEGVVAHHLTFLGGQAKGSKECDSRTVPLCGVHHFALHSIGCLPIKSSDKNDKDYKLPVY